MSQTTSDEVSLADRIREDPRPAIVWVVGLALLVGVEIGALVQVAVELVGAVVTILPGDAGATAVAAARDAAAGIPSLLSREVLPNEGWRLGPEGPWAGTYLGLEPKHAWAGRVVLVYAYFFAVLAWFWYGYLTFRRHYRTADWTPRDDMVDRLRGHRWGQFGLIVVLLFIGLATFAPVLSPTTVEANIFSPYEYEFTYWDDEAGEVSTALVGEANLQSTSKGAGDNSIGPWSYDDFDRFHPFGTMVTGKDLFTFMAYGARISLAIGVLTMTLAGVLALVMATVTAYYKGLVDLLVILTSDSIQSLPLLMVLIIAVVVFSNTPIAQIYDGALLLTMILALVYWPFLWRAVRGPALQVAEEEWVDAAKSFGQKPWVIMRKHMTPYIIGYMLIYASLSLGGVIIAVAGLTFLGLGINPPTPEWGRAIDQGQPYVATASWHISLIPGALITIVVTAFNALGDGIRDAIDPQSKGAEAGTQTAAAGGGGV